MLCRLASMTVCTSANGSSDFGDASSANREPSGDGTTLLTPAGSETVVDGTSSTDPSLNANTANWSSPLIRYAPYRASSWVNPIGVKCSGTFNNRDSRPVD